MESERSFLFPEKHSGFSFLQSVFTAGKTACGHKMTLVSWCFIVWLGAGQCPCVCRAPGQSSHELCVGWCHPVRCPLVSPGPELCLWGSHSQPGMVQIYGEGRGKSNAALGICLEEVQKSFSKVLPGQRCCSPLCVVWGIARTSLKFCPLSQGERLVHELTDV